MNISSYNTKFGTLTFSQKVRDEYFWEASYQWKKLYSCLFLCLAKVKPSQQILLLLLNKSLSVQISW